MKYKSFIFSYLLFSLPLAASSAFASSASKSANFPAELANQASPSISYIEVANVWYYVYDAKGKKIHTFSSNIGELQGYCADYLVVKNGSWIYVYEPTGRKCATLSTSSVGTVVSVSGGTFTSRLGSWLYTWDRNGKKIATRAAR